MIEYELLGRRGKNSDSYRLSHRYPNRIGTIPLFLPYSTAFSSQVLATFVVSPVAGALQIVSAYGSELS